MNARSCTVIAGRLRECISKLRSMTRPMDDQDAEIMSEVLAEMQGCSLHLEDVDIDEVDDSYVADINSGPTLNSSQIAAELGKRMGD